MTKSQKQQQLERALKNIEFARGKQIAVNIVSVSRSGMSRTMKFYTEGFQDITEEIAIITGNRYNEQSNTLSVSGCGMDMVFSVLSNLNYAMAKYDTGKTLQELLKTGECGVRIYDTYFINANRYKTL